MGDFETEEYVMRCMAAVYKHAWERISWEEVVKIWPESGVEKLKLEEEDDVKGTECRLLATWEARIKRSRRYVISCSFQVSC